MLTHSVLSLGALSVDVVFGQIIMSRYPFDLLRLLELRSRFKRFAVIATLHINSRRVGVASVDLDQGTRDDKLRCLLVSFSIV